MRHLWILIHQLDPPKFHLDPQILKGGVQKTSLFIVIVISISIIIIIIIGKWFEPFSYLFSVIVRVKVVFRKTVVGDWRFDHQSGSHLQSQVKSVSQTMVFMPLGLVWIGQFCRDVIGCKKN